MAAVASSSISSSNSRIPTPRSTTTSSRTRKHSLPPSPSSFSSPTSPSRLSTLRPTSPRLSTSPSTSQFRSSIITSTTYQQHKHKKPTSALTSSLAASSKTKSTILPTTMPMPVVSYSSSQLPAPIKQHGHSLSSVTTISYPHPSIHPPLRLLTTATCIEACTSLISAQSPPHSPTFTTFVVPSSTTTKSSAGSSSSRANSILDGIQNALGGALTASSPPHSATSIRTSSSSYSAAKESLADFSIAASKRSNSSPAVSSSDRILEPSRGGVIRSRSNYVSFPNFDEVDFVDVAMVDDNEEDDDEDDHPGWAGPDSPPEGQRPSMMDSSLNEKSMRFSGLEGPSRIGLGMPTSPSQHWLLQLETYQALQVNGV